MISDLDLDLARDRAREFARDIEHDLAEANRLFDIYNLSAYEDAYYEAIDRLRDFGRDIADVLARVRDRDVVRDRALAKRLLATATQLLPLADQSRYLEELRAELDDIAADGGSRRAQVAYAMHQLRSAWWLRAELRVPRRRGAAQ